MLCLRSVLFVVGTFAIGSQRVDGKSCPEISKPHASRCDKYFRCVTLPSKTHVWVPSQCSTGLIYEPTLKTCVLPGEEWECNLINEVPIYDDDNDNVYGVNNLESLIEQLGGYYSKESSSSSHEVTTLASIDDSMEESQIDHSNDESSENYLVVGSASEEEDFEVQDELTESVEPVNSISVPILVSTESNESVVSVSDDLDYSGDGDGYGDGDGEIDQESVSININQNLTPEDKTTYIPLPVSSDVDSNSLSLHLKRLSQIIQSVREQQQKNHSIIGFEIPDRLTSSFLNYNIENQQQNSAEKVTVPADGKIHPEIITLILRQHGKLKKTVPVSNQIQVTTEPYSPLPAGDEYIRIMAISNQAVDQKGANLTKTQSPDRHPYSSPSIVVNHPFDDVTFSMSHADENQTPAAKQGSYISEETLKTVLEFSKQVAANTKVAENDPIKYMQPIIRPVYFTYPFANQRYPSNILLKQKDTRVPNMENFSEQPDGNVADIRFVNNYPEVNDYEKIWSHINRLDGAYNKIKPNNIVQNTKIALTVTNGNPENGINTIVNKTRDILPETKMTTAQTSPTTTTGISSVYDFEESTPIVNYIKPAVYQESVEHSKPFSSKYSSSEHKKITKHSPRPYKYAYRPTPPSSITKLEPKDYEYVSWSSDAPVAATKQQKQARPSPTFGTISSSYSSNHHEQLGLRDGSDNESIATYLSSYLDQTQSPPLQPQQPLHDFDLDRSRPTDTRHKVIEIGGTFVDYSAYRDSLRPLIKQQNVDGALLDFPTAVNCIQGLRQPNATDCTRYFICNPNTSAVSMFSCPLYTAFDKTSLLCDAKSYLTCFPFIKNQKQATVEMNKRLQANLFKNFQSSQGLKNALMRFQLQNNENNIHRVLQSTTLPGLLATTQRARRKTKPSAERQVLAAKKRQPASNGVAPARKQNSGLRRERCRKEGMLVDPANQQKYYLCFRGAQGRFKVRRMVCQGGLIFCNKSRLCTLPARC